MTSDSVPETLRRALARRGFDVLTPVQRAVLAAPAGDLLVSAPTGSGKTVAFGLALAAGLLDEGGHARRERAPRALVVTPTRELAVQVRDELAWLYADAGARALACVGGADPRGERAGLAQGCELVVGTPGRLRDHLGRGALDVRPVAAVVLDEADMMLEMGFRDDLDVLMRAVAPGRRTLMFSATFGARAEALASAYQTAAARLDLGAGGAVRLEAVAVAPGDRARVVAALLRRHAPRTALVFCARRAAVAELAGWLAAQGFTVAALSGELAQNERTAALAALRDGRAGVGVATDLAARGLDLPRLDLVVHADLPANAEALTHRSGRAGRAGRPGLAVLVAPHPQRRRALALIARAGVAAEWVAAPPAVAGEETPAALAAAPAAARPWRRRRRGRG